MVRVPKCKGSYHPRKNGGFQVKYAMGWSDATKRYEEYREDVDFEAEAIALLKEINDFVYHGGKPTEVPKWRKGKEKEEASCSITVEQFADEFTSLREKQKKVQSRTIESDRVCFKRIKPYIGALTLAEVTPQVIDFAYACMRSEGPENKTGVVYSGTTLQKTHAFLSMLFDKAVDYEYIEKNPLAKVEQPKRDTEEKVPLTPEQAQALFSGITSAPLEAKSVGVLLCLGCGLRLSEMLALKWSDYSGGVISVTKSLMNQKQGFKKPKNNESRTVPCPPPLLVVLENWLTNQQDWYAEQGLVWSSDVPIVHSRVGNHTLQRSFGKWWERKRVEWPIPDDFTVHSLRHTYITLLNRDCGVDTRTTRSLSGHKSEQAFFGYTHTNEEWQRRAACDLGRIIAPSEDSKRCQNCKLWTMSPNDATVGSCWAATAGEADHPMVVVKGALHLCDEDSFVTKAIA